MNKVDRCISEETHHSDKCVNERRHDEEAGVTVKVVCRIERGVTVQMCHIERGVTVQVMCHVKGCHCKCNVSCENGRNCKSSVMCKRLHCKGNVSCGKDVTVKVMYHVSSMNHTDTIFKKFILNSQKSLQQCIDVSILFTKCVKQTRKHLQHQSDCFTCINNTEISE